MRTPAVDDQVSSFQVKSQKEFSQTCYCSPAVSQTRAFATKLDGNAAGVSKPKFVNSEIP